MAEYINPRVDWAFKRIFGSDDTKECLITFLNGVTPVYTVCFMDFIVKMGIPCQFRTDIGLGLLTETSDSQEQTRKKKSSKAKTWQLSGLQYGFEKMRIVFLQLPLFEKKEPECMEKLDCWIYVLNNMEHLKEIPFLDKYPVFRKLATIGDLRKLTPEEREYYEDDIKVMRDLYATDKWEKKKRQMAREKAWAEGKAEGIAEGKAEGIKKVAQSMLLDGLPDEQIITYTGLTQEQINSLKN